ncbi:hypothetical protein CH282_01520 [Rhodococcus sp. 06-418-1B]|nr:helix-turn-helix domain-containing protein [Rhodococcus sp. 06-418-1B]OZC92972.1 hypothetical protein CH282_01520 [Rhodococcus sp. 06-418-1B]
MEDQRERRLRVAAARADFLEFGQAGAVGVADIVAASWQRSQTAGVDAETFHVDFHENLDFDSRLVRCARPVLERLTFDMADVPVSIALCDARARIVDRKDCSAAVGRLLDRVDFQPGFSFEEGCVGTNGVGTVYESGTAISVVGAEHFNSALTQFACTGAPIVDPISGRIEGVLDVSLVAESWTPLIHALVKSAANDIGRNLLLDRGQKQRALFEAYLKADSRPDRAVMAVGSSVMINSRARYNFTSEEQNAIQQHALFLTARSDRVAETLLLESGRDVHIRAARVLSGSEVAGILILPQPVPSAEHVSVGAPSPASDDRNVGSAGALNAVTERASIPSRSHVDWKTAAWTAAGAEIEYALSTQSWVVVAGEPGTGKYTILAEAYRRAYPAGSCKSVVAGQDLYLHLQSGGAHDGPPLIVIRNLDLLTDADSENMVRAIRAVDRRQPFLVAATMSDATSHSNSAFSRLIPYFDTSVSVPALRHRVADHEQLIARILRDLAPGRRTRISPEALRVVNSYTWSRNVTQLREALGEALQRRPVGEVQACDLPAYCRTTSSRALSNLEIAERDAIVDALVASDNNRRNAASYLGMSRSSLYRKLRRYGIGE